MIRKGDIYYIFINSMTVPYIVCSHDTVNETYSHVIVAPISLDLTNIYSFEYVITNVPKLRGKIMFDQIRSIKKDRLTEKIGSVSMKDIPQINMILKFFLGI